MKYYYQYYFFFKYCIYDYSLTPFHSCSLQRMHKSYPQLELHTLNLTTCFTFLVCPSLLLLPAEMSNKDICNPAYTCNVSLFPLVVMYLWLVWQLCCRSLKLRIYSKHHSYTKLAHSYMPPTTPIYFLLDQVWKYTTYSTGTCSNSFAQSYKSLYWVLSRSQDLHEKSNTPVLLKFYCPWVMPSCLTLTACVWSCHASGWVARYTFIR